jgi:aldoxime dehydratase
MSFHVIYPRTVPERRPPNHRPAAPRYTLRWETPVHTVISDYFAIQGRALPWERQGEFIDRMLGFFKHSDGPDAFETMRCVDEPGYTNAIVVAYWLDPTKHARWGFASHFTEWFRSPHRESEDVGYWRETIAVPYDHHETVYSEPNYLIGLARCAGGSTERTTTNGYFGAARDRIPVSAIDPLESPLGDNLPPRKAGTAEVKRRQVYAPLNLVAIRSGQFWANAQSEQKTDYLEQLQPKLMRGMKYLEENKNDTGCLSVRVMSNVNASGEERAETSTLAYFLSLGHMERWSKSHETHLDIYRHAIAMNRKFGAKREVITWHEVFVLTGSNRFEYINCHDSTGILPYCEETPV